MLTTIALASPSCCMETLFSHVSKDVRLENRLPIFWNMATPQGCDPFHGKVGCWKIDGKEARVNRCPPNRKHPLGNEKKVRRLFAAHESAAEIPHGEEHPESENDDHGSEDYEKERFDSRPDGFDVYVDFPFVHSSDFGKES